jgi:hypothetical protein
MDDTTSQRRPMYLLLHFALNQNEMLVTFDCLRNRNPLESSQAIITTGNHKVHLNNSLDCGLRDAT